MASAFARTLGGIYRQIKWSTNDANKNPHVYDALKAAGWNANAPDASNTAYA